MKLRIVVYFLFVVMIFSMCACTDRKPGTPASNPSMSSGIGSSPEAKNQTAKEIAESLMSHPVSELYQAIGEPLSSDYASSCTGPGQDGELNYDGFKVYTYREGNSEKIVAVY